MSRILIDPIRFFFVAPPSSIFTTLSFIERSCLMTSSRFGASIVADFSSPLIARAVYVHGGIRVLLASGSQRGVHVEHPTVEPALSLLPRRLTRTEVYGTAPA